MVQDKVYFEVHVVSVSEPEDTNSSLEDTIPPEDDDLLGLRPVPASSSAAEIAVGCGQDPGEGEKAELECRLGDTPQSYGIFFRVQAPTGIGSSQNVAADTTELRPGDVLSCTFDQDQFPSRLSL